MIFSIIHFLKFWNLFSSISLPFRYSKGFFYAFCPPQYGVTVPTSVSFSFHPFFYSLSKRHLIEEFESVLSKLFLSWNRVGISFHEHKVSAESLTIESFRVQKLRIRQASSQSIRKFWFKVGNKQKFYPLVCEMEKRLIFGWNLGYSGCWETSFQNS